MLEILTDGKVLATFFAAALSALVAVVLWLSNKRWERERADVLRAEKVRDLMQALLAEVESYVYLLTLNNLDNHLTVMTEKITAAPADDKFVPVVPRESHDTVYLAFLEEIHLLPGSVVGPVVRYYNQVRAIANFAEDMSTERFSTISARRMSGMYRDFIVMKKIAQEMGEDARRALRTALKLGYQPFNTPAAVQYGPE